MGSILLTRLVLLQAAIVLPDANQDLALRSILFAALGTAGQRCTTTRRLLVHKSISETFLKSLVNAFSSAARRMGAPEDSSTLVGPLHSQLASEGYETAIKQAKKEGGKILFGGEKWAEVADELKGGNWVIPAMIQYDSFEGIEIVRKETFAPSEFGIAIPRLL
jgi:aldehyde dehydrogenase family 7 protein A1